LTAGAWSSLCQAARSSKLPLRSSPRVNTFFTPALNARVLTHGKLRGLQTTTLGSALPTKYSISPAWYAVLSGR
jgi:hypothetical protein